MVLQTQALPFNRNNQTQSFNLCSWRAINLGRELLGDICTSGELGFSQTSIIHCIHSQTWLKKHILNPRLPPSWSQYHGIHGTSNWIFSHQSFRGRQRDIYTQTWQEPILTQASRINWFEKIKTDLIDRCFTPSQVDPRVFYLQKNIHSPNICWQLN